MISLIIKEDGFDKKFYLTELKHYESNTFFIETVSLLKTIKSGTEDEDIKNLIDIVIKLKDGKLTQEDIGKLQKVQENIVETDEDNKDDSQFLGKLVEIFIDLMGTADSNTINRYSDLLLKQLKADQGGITSIALNSENIDNYVKEYFNYLKLLKEIITFNIKKLYMFKTLF